MTERKFLTVYFSWGGHTRKAAKLIAELLAIVLDLELLFVIRDIVENDLDLSELFLDLLIELFALCLLLR